MGVTRRQLLVGAGVVVVPWRERGVTRPVEELDRVVDRIDAAYPTADPVETLGALRIELPVIRRSLLGARGAKARELHRVAGRARVLQGNAFVDTAQPVWAERSFRLASGHGYESGDTGILGWTYLGMSMLANNAGDHANAVAIANLGLARRRTGPVAARLHAEGAAVPASQVGDLDTVRRALDAAWRITGDAPAAEPGWRLDTMTPAELGSTSAYCLGALAPGEALGYAALAEPLLDQAGSTGHRGLIRLDRAKALVAAREYDAAEAAISEALAISADRRTDVVTRGVLDLAARMRRPDLADRVRAWRDA